MTGGRIRSDPMNVPPCELALIFLRAPRTPVPIPTLALCRWASLLRSMMAPVCASMKYSVMSSGVRRYSDARTAPAY